MHDEALLARCRNGDRHAFGELVAEYEPRIHGLVRRYIRNEADAQDVVQSTFTRAFERVASFRGDAPFRAWLCRIAINQALNHKRGTPAADTHVPLEDDVAFTKGLGTETLMTVQLWQKVHARLEDLPPKQRLTIELRVFHDLSFEEIGDVLGSGEESAKANYHHAVKRLRALLPHLSAE
jgi:RNA polymerase sigma-70 factor (ECF subfamily)